MTVESIVAVALAVALAPWSAAHLMAQESALSVDFRAGASVPVGSFADAGDLAGDVSFGVHLGYRLDPRTSIRLGFSQHRFACPDEPGPGPCAAGAAAGEGGMDGYVVTGWEVGARVRITPNGPRPWVGLAGVFARVEEDWPRDDRGDVSDLAAGFDVSAGLDVPVGRRLRLTPAVRYGWLNTRIPGRDLLRMRSVIVDLGVTLGF